MTDSLEEPSRPKPPPLPSEYVEPPPQTKILHLILEHLGMSVAIVGDRVVESSTGIELFPEGGQILQSGGGMVATCTTITAYHTTLFPDGLMEFQHAVGKDQMDAISSGFATWQELDWPVLLDACLEEPQHCMSMEMKFPATESQGARTRRVILGPVQLMGPADEVDPSSENGHSNGCACCLFTHTALTFGDQLKDVDNTYAIRLFAMRDQDGNVSSDCRINGQDWEEGAAALRRYASTWPTENYQSRKQYILVQSKP